MDSQKRRLSTASNDSDLINSTAVLRFHVKYETSFGQQLHICGNLEELGNWNVEKSPKMETNDSLYPIWESSIQLNCPVGMTIEYKYVVTDENGKLIEWEKLPNDEKHKITTKQPGDYIVQDQQNQIKAKIINNANQEFTNIKNQDENQIKNLKLRFLERRNSSASSAFVSSLGPIELISYENNKNVEILNETPEFLLNQKIKETDVIIIATHYLPIKLIRKGEEEYEIEQNEDSSLYGLLNTLKTKKKIRILWVGFLREYFDLPEEEIEIIDDFLQQNDYYIICPKKEDWNNYNIYLNNILLPIFINASFDYSNEYLNDNEKYFEAFNRINMSFSDKISVASQENCLIILNDIDLALVPIGIIQKNNNANIGMYIHTNFPASDIWKAIPRNEVIINSLLLCNVIGFHLFTSCRNFTTVLRRFFGLFYQINSKGLMTIQYLGRTILLGVRQGQTDRDYLLQLTKNEEFIKYDNQFKEENKDLFNIISFDYVGAEHPLCNKLCAIEDFCEKNSDLVDKVKFTFWIKEFGSGSNYDKLTKEYISKTVDLIQKKFLNKNLIKIEYTYTYNIYKRLAIFKNSELFWYPLSFEGHGIYPNEFCTMQNENKRYGLILSDNTTSCINRKNIIKVNPYDFYKMSKAIKRIYYREPDKQRYEMDYLYLKQNSVMKWMKNFILDLKRIKFYDSTNKITTGLRFNFKLIKLNDKFSHFNVLSLIKYYKRSANKLFFFDYENTLQALNENICNEPNHTKEEKLELLKPEKRLIKLMKILSEEKGNQVYILSKYETDYLYEYFGKIPNIGLCCENGFYYKHPDDKEFNNLVEVKDWSWKDTVIKILKTFTEKTEGSFIIEKKSSLIWNFNNSDETFGPLQADEIKTHITSIFNSKILEITSSSSDGILEIKPKNVNKGYFVAKILQEQFKEQNIDLIVAVGDDLSDENMFDYFRSAEKYFRNFNTKIKTFTATINKKPSNAKYFFNDINDLIETLDALSHQNFVKEFKKDGEEIKAEVTRSYRKKLSVNLNHTMFKFRADKKFKGE